MYILTYLWILNNKNSHNCLVWDFDYYNYICGLFFIIFYNWIVIINIVLGVLVLGPRKWAEYTYECLYLYGISTFIKKKKPWKKILYDYYRIFFLILQGLLHMSVYFIVCISFFVCLPLATTFPWITFMCCGTYKVTCH